MRHTPTRLPYSKKDSLKRSRRSGGTGDGTSPIVSRRGPSRSEYSAPSSYETETWTARRAPFGQGTTGGVSAYPTKSRSMGLRPDRTVAQSGEIGSADQRISNGISR